MLIHSDTRQTAGMAEGHLTSEGCKKETRSKPLQPKWEMSCAARWGDARLEITPTIHNIPVYFLCQLRDKQQHDYKGIQQAYSMERLPNTTNSFLWYQSQVFKKLHRAPEEKSNVFSRNGNSSVIFSNLPLNISLLGT